MKVKSLHWKYIKGTSSVWVGELAEPSLLIRFELQEIEEDKYHMTSNIEGIRSLIIRGIDNAKNMAQEQLNTYATGIIK